MLKTKKRLIGFITLLSALCMCVASLLCGNTVKANGPTSASSLTMSSGAWIKESNTANENGFRYVAAISADDYNAFTGYGEGNVEYGVMLCKTEDIENTADADLRFDSGVLSEYDGTTNVKVFQTKTVKPIVDVDDFNGNGDTTEYIFICSFIGIKDANFAVDFTARGYLGYRTNSSDVFSYLYTNTVDKSVFEVSYKHELDDKTETSTYATSVITSVVEDYPNFTVDATVESATVTTVKIGDEVTLNAKLYNEGETESIEVTPKYTLDSLATENSNGTYTVKSLNGFSGKAIFPTLTDEAISIAGAENQAYTATIDDLGSILKLTKGYQGERHSHTNVAECSDDIPTFSTTITDADAPADAEYELHYNAAYANVGEEGTSNYRENQIASNYCKGVFAFDKGAYGVGDYITFDIYYPIARSALTCGDNITHNNTQSLKHIDVNTPASSNKGTYNIVAYNNMGVPTKISGNSSNNGWFTFVVQVQSEDLEFGIWTQSDYANDENTYYLKNIRIANCLIRESKLGITDTSAAKLGVLRNTTQGFKTITGDLVPEGAEYQVGLYVGVTFGITPRNIESGYVLSFDFYNKGGNYNRVRVDKPETYIVNYSTNKYSGTAVPYIVGETTLYTFEVVDSNGDAVTFTDTTKHENEWLTVKVTYLNKNASDLWETFTLSTPWHSYGSGYSNSTSAYEDNKYAYVYFKNFTLTPPSAE